MNPGQMNLPFKDDASSRSANLLCKLILVELALFLTVGVLSIFWKDWKTVSLLTFATLIQIVPFLLLKHGRLRTSALVFMLINVAVTTSIAMIGQGIYDLGIMALPVIFVFTGLTLNRRFLWLCVGLALTAACWLVLGQNLDWLPLRPLPDDPSHILYLAGVISMLLVAAFAVDMLTANARRNLEQAQVEISQRNKIEAELRLSEEKFRNLFNNAEVGMIRTRMSDSRILDINQRAAEIFGINPEDALKTGGMDFWADPDKRKEAVDTLKSQGFIKDFENQVLSKQGQKKDCLTSWKVYPELGIIEGSIVDITDRKRAEEILRKSEDKFSKTFQSSPIMMTIATSDGKYIDVNKAFLCEIGLRREEVIGRTSMDLGFWPPEIRHREMSRLFSDGHISNAQVRVKLPSGETRDVLFSSEPIELDNQTCSLNQIIDVTEQKKIEQENARLRDKEEMVNRLATMGEMAAGIAHEINNPLTAVLGFAELLSLRDDLPDEVHQDVMLIAQNSQRTGEIVRRMLAFAGQSIPKRISCDINEIILSTLELRKYVHKTANIHTFNFLAPDLPRIVCDPGQLQQVFLNIVINAEYSVKKAHDGGTITITTAITDNSIRITFEDDGLGMNAETREKIFNPFFTTKGVGQGTGLGLSLSHTIVLAHGGNIEVASEPGKGAAFTVILPITSNPEVKAAGPQNGAPKQKIGSAGRILVVDDEEDIRTVLKRILSDQGLETDVASTGQEALGMIAKNKYSLVLVDIRMPGMSGIELFSKLTERGLPAEKLLYITGDVLDANALEFLDSNNLPYLKKPFQTDELLKQIETVLSIHR